MKTSELSGAALDWAVAKAEGVTCAVWQGLVVDEFSNPLMYHDDWALGGAIIEREKIAVYRDDMDVYWWGKTNTTKPINGETPLIAAMRCYVASKLGNEVQIPEGL